VADGLTKSETTPARHLPTSGDRPLDTVIVDDDDDGDDWSVSQWWLTACWARLLGAATGDGYHESKH